MIRGLSTFLAAVLLVLLTAVPGQALRAQALRAKAVPTCFAPFYFPRDQLALAGRIFHLPTDSGPGAVDFGPTVDEYATDDLAAATFSEWIERLRSSADVTVLDGVGTHILDESIVFVAKELRRGRRVPYTEVVFRDGRYVHHWIVPGADATSVSFLFDVIRHMLARGQLPATTGEPTATPDAGLDVARLFAQLPDVSDVPRGSVLYDEACLLSLDAETNDATPIAGESAAPGSTFGDVAEGMGRISLATADDLAEGCRRIVRFAERQGALPATVAAQTSA